MNEKPVLMKIPTVFEYLDIHSYLKDYYTARKNKEGKFSYESWSFELEFNSRSFLRMMVLGKKKITPSFVEAFTKLNFSSKAEEDYFKALVEQSIVSTQAEKSKINSRMMSLLKHHHSFTPIDDYKRFLSSPLIPRLFCLMSFEDITNDLEFFTRHLNAEPSEVLRALDLLVDMELAIEKPQNGKTLWHATSDVFRVPDSKGSLDLMAFHEQSLNEAIKSFHRPKEERSYKSLLLPLSETDLQDFQQVLNDFSRAQMLRYNSKKFAGKNLWQININFYSVTKTQENNLLAN